jgi:hypothetical protein
VEGWGGGGEEDGTKVAGSFRAAAWGPSNVAIHGHLLGCHDKQNRAAVYKCMAVCAYACLTLLTCVQGCGLVNLIYSHAVCARKGPRQQWVPLEPSAV